MRYAVQHRRQSASSPHGPSGRDIPCRDVPRRVDIRVARLSTGHAREESLALATLRCHIPTHRTTLAAERGIDPLHSTEGFMLQPSRKQAPAGGEDRPVQPSLLPHVPTRLRNGATRGAHHVVDLQVLDADQVVAACDIGAGLFDPVLTPIGITGMHPRQAGLRQYTAVRTTLTPRQRTRRSGDRQRPRCPIPDPVRAGQSDRHTPVDPHHAAITGPGDRGGNHGKCDVPASNPVADHPARLRLGQRAGATEANPADLRDQNPRPPSVQLLHPPRPWTNNPESLVPPSGAPRRAVMGALAPVTHGVGEVPQRLLLHGLRALAQPPTLRPRLSQLTALLDEVGAPASGPRPAQLLHRQIPHQPGMPALPEQQRLLRGCRIHPVPRHRRHPNHQPRQHRPLNWPRISQLLLPNVQGRASADWSTR